MEGNPSRLASELEKGGAGSSGRMKSCAQVELIFSGDVDGSISAARDEVYARPGTKPEIRWSTIMEDLHRRDFSINAIAISLNPASRGLLLDPDQRAGGPRESRGARAVHSQLYQPAHPADASDSPVRPDGLQAGIANRGMVCFGAGTRPAREHGSGRGWRRTPATGFRAEARSDPQGLGIARSASQQFIRNWRAGIHTTIYWSAWFVRGRNCRPWGFARALFAPDDAGDTGQVEIPRARRDSAAASVFAAAKWTL